MLKKGVAFSGLLLIWNLMKNNAILHAAWIDTPIGSMIALSKGEKVCRLEFAETPNLTQEVNRLSEYLLMEIIPNSTSPLLSLLQELDLYFKKGLEIFQTPLSFEWGTPFQKRVWEELAKIPYGTTCSYKELAASVGKPTAYRAVAQANGANPLPIVIACHRVINSDGKLGGYNSGLDKKKWLLTHEKTGIAKG